MPASTQESVRKKVDALRKTLAEKGEGMEPLERRKAKKGLRRAQRKQRRLTAEATRRAGKGGKKQEAAAEPAQS
jgi:hypothetical protein